MSSIGIYDVDFWSGAKSTIPNLELMRFFNYHHSRGDLVKLLSPKDKTLKYDRLVCFKESDIVIPKTAKCVNSSFEMKGQGFYGREWTLTSQYRDSKPNFLIYHLKEEKIKGLKQFNDIENNSIVRLSTNDFSGFNCDKKKIYVVDKDFFANENWEDFLKEYSSFKIKLIRQIELKNLVAANKILSYTKTLGKRVYFNVNLKSQEHINFAIENLYNKLLVYTIKPPQSDIEFVNLIKLILYIKNSEDCERKLQISKPSQVELKKYPICELTPHILVWSTSPYESFYDYCSFAAAKLFKSLCLSKSSIRLISKQKQFKGLDFK